MASKPAIKTVWLGTAEIAQRYGFDSETVRLWIVRGVSGPEGPVRLRAIQIGRRWMIRRRWLKEFLAACERPRDQPEPLKVETETKKQQRFRSEQEAVRRRLGG